MSPQYKSNGWYWLVRVHDRIWNDRSIPLKERMQSTDLLSSLAAQIATKPIRWSAMYDQAEY